jgi:hypothetical protein
MKIKTNNDMSKILRGYSNKWVVLDSTASRVVVAGKEPKDVVQIARDRGVDHPILTRVPAHYGVYIL